MKKGYFAFSTSTIHIKNECYCQYSILTAPATDVFHLTWHKPSTDHFSNGTIFPFGKCFTVSKPGIHKCVEGGDVFPRD